MTKYIFVGMALQALTTSLLTFLGLINPEPGQQLMAGVFFLVTVVTFQLVKRATRPAAGAEQEPR